MLIDEQEGAQDCRLESHWQLLFAAQSGWVRYAYVHVFWQIAPFISHMYELRHVVVDRKAQDCTHCADAASHIVSLAGLALHASRVGKRVDGGATHDVAPPAEGCWLTHPVVVAQSDGSEILLHCVLHDPTLESHWQSGLLRQPSCVSVMLQSLLHELAVVLHWHDGIAAQDAAVVADTSQRFVHCCRPLFHVQTAARALHCVEIVCMAQALTQPPDDGFHTQRASLLHESAVA